MSISPSPLLDKQKAVLDVANLELVHKIDVGLVSPSVMGMTSFSRKGSSLFLRYLAQDKVTTPTPPHFHPSRKQHHIRGALFSSDYPPTLCECARLTYPSHTLNFLRTSTPISKSVRFQRTWTHSHRERSAPARHNS